MSHDSTIQIKPVSTERFCTPPSPSGGRLETSGRRAGGSDRDTVSALEPSILISIIHWNNIDETLRCLEAVE